MRKRLVFYIYVDCAFKDSKIYDIHIWNLKQHINIFDCYTVYLSLKDFSEENVEFSHFILKKLFDAGFVENLEVKIIKNTVFREAYCFNEEVVKKINETDSNDLVFFAHTKGLTNIFNRSVFRWICACYYFGLNEKEIFRFLDTSPVETGGNGFYGFPFINWDDRFFYAGSIYWINLGNIRMLSKKKITLSDRGLAEQFPCNTLPYVSSYTYKNVLFYLVNMYEWFDCNLDRWFDDYSFFEEKEQFNLYCEKIMRELDIRL